MFQILCCIPIFGLIFLYFAGMLVFWYMVALENALGDQPQHEPDDGPTIRAKLKPIE